MFRPVLNTASIFTCASCYTHLCTNCACAAANQAHLRVDTVRGDLRGTVATKDLAAGEVVLAVPASLGIPLGEYGEYSSAVRACDEQGCSGVSCQLSACRSSPLA